MTGAGIEVPTIGVQSGQLVGGSSPLFQALGAAFGVKFCELDDGRSIDGHDAVVLDGPPPELLATAKSTGRRTLVFAPPGGGRPILTSDEIRFGRHESVDHHLRGRRLRDHSITGLPAVSSHCGQPGDEGCLASAGGLAVWSRWPGPGGAMDLVACPLPELAPGQALRELLSVDRLAAMVPMVHLLRELTAEAGWRTPPLRACFVVDDPNLRFNTYGRVDYRRVVEEAERRPFHMSVATVPLDSWLTPRRAVAKLFQADSHLSISVHGNNHTRSEWSRDVAVEDYIPPLAVALRRMDRLVERGISYDRVQVAPHNRCSAEAATAMALLDYEGLTIPLSFRERAGLTDPVLTGGWQPADITPDGLPVLVRTHVDDGHDDFALRAFLGVPIVLYGHHEDMGSDDSTLSQRVDEVNRLGDVQWIPLGEILRSNVVSAVHGDTVTIRPYSRRFTVDVPPGVNKLAVDVDEDHPLACHHRLVIDGVPAGSAIAGPVNLDAGAAAASGTASATSVEVSFEHKDRIAYDSVPRQQSRPWPIVRRLLAEARDRTASVRPVGRKG